MMGDAPVTVGDGPGRYFSLGGGAESSWTLPPSQLDEWLNAMQARADGKVPTAQQPLLLNSSVALPRFRLDIVPWVMAFWGCQFLGVVGSFGVLVRCTCCCCYCYCYFCCCGPFR
jgi:hypothetical protein